MTGHYLLDKFCFTNSGTGGYPLCQLTKFFDIKSAEAKLDTDVNEQV
jgi:hypothetical protein